VAAVVVAWAVVAAADAAWAADVVMPDIWLDDSNSWRPVQDENRNNGLG
jgi:hypothetical protein